MEGTHEGAKLMFADGSSEIWVSDPSLDISGSAIAEFMRVCTVPTPVKVEVIEVSSVAENTPPTDALEQ